MAISWRVSIGTITGTTITLLHTCSQERFTVFSPLKTAKSLLFAC